MKNLLVAIPLSLLLGFGIGYAVRSNQDTFFRRCLHAYGYDQESSDKGRRSVERRCLNKETRSGSVQRGSRRLRRLR